MSRLWTLHIKDLTLLARIGFYAWEQEGPQKIVVNVECDYLAPVPGVTQNDLGAILDYDAVVIVIREKINAPHIYFLETLIDDIGQALLEDHRVERISIQIYKPLVKQEAHSIGVSSIYVR